MSGTDALDLERKKFQTETLRTSRLASALRSMTEVFISEGHRDSSFSARKCPRCRLVMDAMEALHDTIYYEQLKHQENPHDAPK